MPPKKKLPDHLQPVQLFIEEPANEATVNALPIISSYLRGSPNTNNNTNDEDHVMETSRRVREAEEQESPSCLCLALSSCCSMINVCSTTQLTTVPALPHQNTNGINL